MTGITIGHTIQVMRRSGDKFIGIGAGEKVLPNEPIRLAANGISTFMKFRVLDGAGNEVISQEVGVTLGGSAWLDMVAPSTESEYRVEAWDSDVPFIRWPTHVAYTTFVVSKDAPGPPAPPGGGFDWKWLLYGGLAIGAVYLVMKLRRKNGKP